MAGITAVGQVSVTSAATQMYAAGFHDPKPGPCHRVLGRAASHGQHLPCSSRASTTLSAIVRACNRTAALHGSRFAPACSALLSVTAVALAKLLLTRLIR